MEPVVREHKQISSEAELWKMVEELLEREGYRAESWEMIASLGGSQCLRGTFKVLLKSGSLMKARVFDTLERATRYRTFRPEVSANLSSFLAWNHRAILEEWVDGREFSLSPQNVKRAAELLAQIHKSRELELTPGEYWAEPYLKQLDFVRGRELVSESQFSQLSGKAQALAGESVKVGLIHYDFCGENLVLDKSGQLWSVDNEHLQLGPLELDLARAWLRWPMPEELWTLFYGEFKSDIRPELRDFWRAFAVLESLAIRAEWKAPSSPRALGLLRVLLA